MIIRSLSASALLLVTACGTASVPDSNPQSGVGFRDYNQYSSDRARRDAALEARKEQALTEERAIAQETLGVLNVEQPAGEPVQTASIEGVSTGPNNPGISDEQNFDAVSSRETIESDRQRLERNQQTYEVATPEALPERPRSNGASIVTYALQTNNPVGQPLYKRSERYNEGKYRRACAEFGSADQAQTAFLEAGGPKRDRKGLDPDGDGFACFWDPTPFRAARGG